jgi:hypothetical protein
MFPKRCITSACINILVNRLHNLSPLKMNFGVAPSKIIPFHIASVPLRKKIKNTIRFITRIE